MTPTERFVNQMQSAEGLIMRARAHTSVAIYVGGNEQTPCAVLDTGLRALVARLDPSRPYVSGADRVLSLVLQSCPHASTARTHAHRWSL